MLKSIRIKLSFWMIIGSIFINFLNAQNHLKPVNIVLPINNKGMNEFQASTSNDTINNPFIRVFLPTKEKSTGRAVVICPGGAYGMVASAHEGYSWADYFNEQGIAVIVLKYRLPNSDYKIPISDAETALKMVRDSAKIWNINPNDVGIMGSSAGGHLASTIATHTQASLKPKFQLLFYPVITMDKTYTHKGSHDNLLGKNAGKELEILYSNEKQITKDTPPAFLVLSADDYVVPAANGINYFQALVNNNVFAALHIYPKGGHGWGFNKSFKYHEEVLSELTLWLNEIK